MLNILAKRYAEAFYGYAVEQNSLEAAHRDLSEVASVIQDSPDLQRFIANPTFSSQERHEILKSLFQSKVSPEAMNFILFLSKKNRLNCFKEICVSFNRQYREAHGILPVKVFSSLPLSQDENSSIIKRLQEKFQKKIEAQFIISPNLIGGVKVQVDDQVFDFSLQTLLKNFKEKLLFA